jgi:MFS family permease
VSGEVGAVHPAEVTPTRDEARRLALAIAPGVLLAGVASGIAFPILPALGVRAGLPLALIGAILAANRVGRVVAGPIVGAAADRLGGRRLFLAGLVLQIVVMTLFALGVRLDRPGLFFLVGRALHGPGSACVFVVGQALALHAGGREHAGLTGSTVRLALVIGVPVGLVAGGVLSGRFGPEATFEVAALAMVVATLVASFLVPDLRAPVRRGVPIREALRSLSEARLAAVGALNFAASFSAGGLVLTTLVLLVRARGVTVLGLGEQETSSALMGVMVVASAVGTLAMTRIATTPPANARIALAALILLAAGLVVVGLAPGVTGISVGLVILGLGSGALGAALLALVGLLVDATQRGAGVGLQQLCGDIGGSLGPIVGTMLFGVGPAIPYVVCAALAAAFLPVAVWLARRAV